MNLSLLIYLITRVDNIRALFEITTFLSAIGFLVIMGVTITNICEPFIEDKLFPLVKKVRTFIVILLIVSILAIIFVPNSKVICAMYLIPKIANNEEVKKLPNNALKLLNTKLESWIDDMTQKKEN